MSTMIISEQTIINVFNSLIDHMIRDCTNQLQRNIASAIYGSYDRNGGNIDHVIEKLRTVAQSAKTVNVAAYNSQYYGNHDLREYKRLDAKKIGILSLDIKSMDRVLSMIEIAKQFDAILYNSDDDYATDLQTEMIAIIERVSVAVCRWIVTSSKEYDQADWG